jgi:hypothetical protein
MGSRLIWFFGPSAAGKDTLIHATAGERDHPVRTNLHLGGEVEVCEQSLNNDHRDGLAAVIAERTRPEVPLLLKGQTSDMSERHTPQKFKRLPEYEQQIVFVWADPSELARRCAIRAELFRESGDLEQFRYWSVQTKETCTLEMYRHQLPWVKVLELPILCVSTDGDQPSTGPKPPGW